MPKEVKSLLIVVAAVIVGTILLFKFGGTKPPAAVAVDPTRLASSTSHMTGTFGAKVTLVEFGDYQCPACGAEYPVLKQVTDAYASNPNFNFVFRNFPLPMHPNAPSAAEAAEAAGAQGKYWEMHDLLYENQNAWADSTNPITFYVTYAQELGLDVTKFQSDVTSNAYQDVITKDEADGNAINVQWTPSLYLNGVLYQQTPSYAQLKSDIDAALAS